MNLTALLFGADDAQRRLDDTADRARDLTPAWDRLLPDLRAEEREIFATRGHGQWPESSPRTIQNKGRDTPMVDSGRLLRALTLRARGSLSRRKKTQLLFGVNDRSIFWSRVVGKRRPFLVDERTAERLGDRAVLEHLRGDLL